MIQFNCAECGATREVPDEMAGRKLKCQDCRQVGHVPQSKRRQKAEEEIEEVEPVARDKKGFPVWAIVGILVVATIPVLAVASVGVFALSRSAPTTAGTMPTPARGDERPVPTREVFPPGMTADIDAEQRAMSPAQAEDYFRTLINIYPFVEPGAPVNEETSFQRKVLRNKMRWLFKYHPDLDGRGPNQLQLDLLQNRDFDKR